MKEKELAEMRKQHELRKKQIIFWAILASGIVVIVVGVISVAILAVVGLMLLAAALGSIFLGKYLLGLAKAWRQRHLANNTAESKSTV